MNRVDIGVRVNAEAAGFEGVNAGLRDTAEGLSDISGKARVTAEEIEKYQQAVGDAIKGGSGIGSLPTFGGQPSSGRPALGGPGGTGSPESAGPKEDVPDEDVPGKRRVIPFPGMDLLRLEKTLKRLPGGISRDVGGEAVNATEGIAGQIGKVWNQLPMAAKVFGGVGIAGAAVMGVGNELSKQYEAVIPSVMSATTALGRFGDTAKEQSDKFRSTMKEVSTASSKFGFTLQQGSAVVQELASGGARGEKALTGAESVMGFAKGYGFTDIPSEITDLYASGERYSGLMAARQAARFGSGSEDIGKSGDSALAYVAGGARHTVGDARMREYADATGSILEDGLGEGIAKGFKEITGTQNFLYSMFGELAGGQRGAQMYQGLSSSVRSATSLQSETDLLLFESAKKSLGEGATTNDILMKMEEGFSPEIFKNFMEQIAGASDYEQSHLVKQAFGVSLTNAGKMLEAVDQGKDVAEVYAETAPGKAIAQTTESELTGQQESIAEYVREIGAKAADAKSGILGATDNIGKILTGETSIPELLNLKTNTAVMNANLVQIYNDSKQKYAEGKPDEANSDVYSMMLHEARNRIDVLYNINTGLIYAAEAKEAGEVGRKLSGLFRDFNNYVPLANLGDDAYKKLLKIDQLEAGEWTNNELLKAFQFLTEELAKNATAVNSNTNAKGTIVVPSSTVRPTGRGAGGR